MPFLGVVVFLLYCFIHAFRVKSLLENKPFTDTTDYLATSRPKVSDSKKVTILNSFLRVFCMY